MINCVKELHTNRNNFIFHLVFESLKVVFFGDNVPKDRANKAMEAAKGCDALLVLGSSLMTMSAFRLVRYIYLSFLFFLMSFIYL